MSKISMFGVTASGKTCFIYAMAQVLRNGVRHDGSLVQVISNRAAQQMRLNAGYEKLIRREWPQTSDKSEILDFKVSMQCNGYFNEVIPSLQIQDYRGGILEDMSETGEEELENLLESFRESSAIIFIIDGQTLINAMNPEDRDKSHRGNTNILEQFKARTQIEFVENIFMEYKRVEETIPPILIAISKGDVFASDFERSNGIRLIREKLPSIFSIGSQMTAAITIMSLGEGLGSDANGGLVGKLKLSDEYNIHIPLIFGIYSDLCFQYEEATDPEEKKGILALLTLLRKIFANRVIMYISGRPAREV